MRGKKGISAIVAAVLIILITVAGVATIWNVVAPIIQENVKFGEFDGRVDIVTAGGYTFYDEVNDRLHVQVSRGEDDVEMTGLRIIVTTSGNSVSYPNNPNYPDDAYSAPGVNGKATYIIPEITERPDSVAVVPLISDGVDEKEVGVTGKINYVDSSPATEGAPSSATESREGNEVIGELIDLIMGLVSWWKFDGDFLDSVGGNDGVGHGGVGFDSGVGVFDGVDDYVDFSSNPVIDSENWSVSIWFTAAGDAPGIEDRRAVLFEQLSIYYYGDHGAYNLRGITVKRNTYYGPHTPYNTFYFIIGDGDGSFGRTIANFLTWGQYNVWQHLVLVYAIDNTFKIYLNNEVIGDYSSYDGVKYDHSSGKFLLGSSDTQYVTSSYWYGSMDNVMIYNRTLNQDEIDMIYDSQKEGKV